MENVLSCPHTALLYTHPILLLNTVPLKMKYSVMTGCDFIQMNHLSVMVAYLLVPPFKAMDHSYISSLIHLIAVENFFQNQYKNFTVQSLFQILFSKLKESLSYNKSSTFHEMALQQLHINIASNPSSPWNIPDMAKQLHISTRHLQKLYQKKFGTSCMEDVIEHRLLLAKEKLATTTLPIYKIAEQCGYSNVEHFSRQFKEKFTTSPKAYRESVKKN